MVIGPWPKIERQLYGVVFDFDRVVELHVLTVEIASDGERDVVAINSLCQAKNLRSLNKGCVNRTTARIGGDG
jgi:hypothetical protein